MSQPNHRAENLQIRLDYCKSLTGRYHQILSTRDALARTDDEGSPTSSTQDALSNAAKELSGTIIRVLIEHVRYHGYSDAFLLAVKKQLGDVFAIRLFREFAGQPLLEAKQKVDSV